MRIVYISLFLFTAFCAQAQDLTGIWRGHFRSNEIYNRILGADDRYKMEVQIAQQNNAFQSVTYSYKTTVFYGKAEAEGTINSNTKKVLLRELKIVEVRMAAGDACIMTCFMEYSKLNDEEFLEGTYTSMNTRDSTDCGKGTIFLHKVPESDFYKEPFLEKKEKQLEVEKKNPVVTAPPADKKTTTAPDKTATATPKKITKPNNKAVKKTNTPATASNAVAKKTTTPQHKNVVAHAKPATVQKDLAKTDNQTIETFKKDSVTKIEKRILPAVTPKVLADRSNELVKSLTVHTQEVVLNIYDDGAIDNDTVSVYFDKKLIVSKARLTDQPIVVKLHLDESSEPHELIMVAENLGDIPPNTSLMIVKAGEKRFEVRIVSTEQKNAEVLFKYEKPE